MWLTLVGVAILILVIGIATTFSGKNNDAKAETPSGETVTWVTLQGVGECSDVVDLDTGPPGENFFGLYPKGTAISFLDHDGKTILLDDLPDEPITASGSVCFLGPAGERVRVRQVPD